MNDELNKNLSGEGSQENTKAEENAEISSVNEENTAVSEEETAAASLNEELEALRETFQEKYDETVEEAENGPVIQELEEGEPEDEEEADEETDEEAPVQEKKPKKKRKIGKIIAITIPVLLLVVIIGSLGAYVFASMTNPNFSSFISTYAQATAAETYDDKITYLEKALEYCSDEESVFQKAMAATINEEIVVAMSKNEGYGAAYSYMMSKMSEDSIKNPVNAEFRKFVNSVNDIKKLSLGVFNKVYENLGDAKEAPGYETLSAGLNIPETVEETMKEILKLIADGFIKNREAVSLDESVVAMNYYANAYSGLLSIGADERALAEQIVIDLYNKGFVIEAATLASVAVDTEKEAVNKEYTEIYEKITAVADTGVNVLELGKKAKAEEKTSFEDILVFVKTEDGVTEENAKIFAAFTEYAVKALIAEEEKNLTEASSAYATLTSVLEAFTMADASIHLKTAQIIFDSGNLSDASTLVTTYLNEDSVKALSEEEKAVYDKMNSVFEALEATSEIFSPFYADYYQTGAAMDYDKIKAAFDEKFDENATDYEKGFVYYCLYFAATSSEDEEKTAEAINGMSRYLSELPLVYLYYSVDSAVNDNDLTAAKEYAEKILDVNIADGFANSIIAMNLRASGDLDGAVEKALKGVELAGTSPDCELQLAVAYLLKGEMEKAFGYITSVYNESQTLDAFDLVLIFDKLYEGDNEDINTELDTLVATVNQTYAYYGLSAQEDTKAILDGNKTLEDVFMSGNYSLS